MKTIVVTGGAGFIGSHLCQALVERGEKAICVDNFSTGRRENLEGIEGNERFSLLEQDITKPFSIEGKVDQIYNLASPASPLDFKKMPLEILAVNSFGTRNMLEIAAKKRARFLEASTSEVYGNPLEHPQKESYLGNVNIVGERSCYDESKRFSEALVTAYARKKGVDARIARIFNTYGPKMRADDGRVVPNFITQALGGKALTVYGKGEQTRSFCFVADLVAGLQALMRSDYAKPVNLGNPNEITIAELADTVLKLTGSKSKIEFKGLPADDPARRQPDISVAREHLKWGPKVGLEQGLKETIEFFRK